MTGTAIDLLWVAAGIVLVPAAIAGVAAALALRPDGPRR